MRLEEFLRARRAAGRSLLVPYVTGGIAPGWTDYVTAYRDAGADAIEIGLPFSDPMLDGTTLQAASDRALACGATVDGILADVAAIGVDVPLIAMTYLNLVLRDGPEEFCAALREAGFAGLIVPDAPVDEAAALEAAAERAGIALVLLAAPSTPPPRLREIVRRSRGFVYAVTLMGATGERRELAATAARLASDIRALTDLPALLGFGISTPEQAAQAAHWADGVVVASSLMRRVLDGATPGELAAAVVELRRALGGD